MGGRVFVWGALLCSRLLFAVDILDTAENIFFAESDRTKVGIEVEFKGLGIDQAAEVVRSSLGGEVKSKIDRQLTVWMGRTADGKDHYQEVAVKVYVVEKTSIGNVTLKPDFNQTSDREMHRPQDVVVELITEPIRFPEVLKLQEALNQLKIAGATGTTRSTPVAIQVNADMGTGKKGGTPVLTLINLMRSYMRPEHREQIIPHLRVAKIRQKYLQPYSDGFLARLLDPEYSPTILELYEDYIYRQSLELLADDRAWLDPIAQIRKRLLAAEFPIVPRVAKLNPLRISSALVLEFPTDPMSVLYQESGWVVARPLVEFREWNCDFDAVTPVRQALGLISAAKQYGYYDHDLLLESISGIDKLMIQKLRREFNEARRKGKILFRYFLGDPKVVDQAEYEEQMKYFKSHPVGFLPSSSYGLYPVVLPGESVVFHRRHFHRNSILGKYNPGLINANIQQALENKYVEFRFWNEYFPGVMAQTVLLKDILGPNPTELSPELIVSRLKARFPEGWVMKGVWDLGSEANILTDKTDLAGILKDYLTSDYDLFAKRTQKRNAQYLDSAPEYLQSLLSEHPNYKGWQIHERLLNPQLSIVQSRLEIAREFRVEGLGGKVLSDGSTLDRWYYTYAYGTQGKTLADYVPPPRGMVSKVEAFTQAILDKLPENLRGIPFGFDIAVLKDGSMRMIESNAGGNSNFLFEEEKESVHALEKFLKRYPKLVQQGKVPTGLTLEEQMGYLDQKFAQWEISTVEQYPGMKFLEDRIEDPDFTRLVPDTKAFTIGKGDACKFRFSEMGRAS